MRQHVVSLFLILTSTVGFSQTEELQSVYSQARAAYTAKNYDAFYTLIKKANEIHPYHQGVLYQCGIAASLINKKQEALAYLKKAILINNDYDLSHPDLITLKTEQEYVLLLQLQQDRKNLSFTPTPRSCCKIKPFISNPSLPAKGKHFLPG